MVNYTRAKKKITHAIITLISSKALLKPAKTRHHWTPQLIRSGKALFGVCKVYKTKVTGAYNEVFYHDSFFILYKLYSELALKVCFVETDFVSGYTNGY